MKRTKPSEVERVTELIDAMIEGRIPITVVEDLARWHLRELRRARGRTVGYLFLYRDERRSAGLGRSIHACYDLLPKQITGSLKDKDVARVVLVRGRGGR